MIKNIANTLTVAEAQIIWYLRKNDNDKAIIKLRNDLNHLYCDRCAGTININTKYSYTPDEIEFLESIKDMSKDELQVLKHYMIKLLEEEE